MKLLIKSRGQGKTTGLIYTSEATGYPIVVNRENEKSYIINQANMMSCNIPTPITVGELRLGAGRGNHKYERVLVDELYPMLEDALNCYLGCHVECATLTR